MYLCKYRLYVVASHSPIYSDSAEAAQLRLCSSPPSLLARFGPKFQGGEWNWKAVGAYKLGESFHERSASGVPGTRYAAR